MTLRIRAVGRSDESWVGSFVELRWGSRTVVSKGRVLYPERLEGFVTEEGDRSVGLLTFRIEDRDCEIVTLDSTVEGRGVGSSLLKEVEDRALSAACRRLWLITTNDNMRALGFYQKRGFEIAALYRGAMEESRRLKPEIPMIGMNGIPLRDEIELEKVLSS